MVIQKVINNNVISAYDVNQQEIVIMGKGIGFKAHTGELIDESKIEKVFRIENENLSRQFQELLENIPLEHMQLTSDIISYAIKNLNVQLNQNIYITLTDHINFAIQRQSQGIQLKNALLWETKKFYHQEYLMGKYAVDLLNEKLGTEFTEDEAGFIALHFVNAEYNTTINDTFEMTNMIQKILELVRLEMGIEFDEESLHYERFITHLKFLVQRLYRHELLKDEEIEFARMMENKYPKEYECSKHIAEYIEKEYGSEIASEEIMFLAIHIKRVCMAG
ncbi:MAG: transcription antiterminator BglG [Roseburia intestinalis]|jgi:beta-glucoside operon transcriptional antiterminator|nr:MAG: transcription antiterminator BglG [Roseburia intestinalis]